jgi:hypothetical protein
MHKDVVSNFYYANQITPTCFGIQMPSSGGFTFLVNYFSFSLRFGWMWAVVCLVWPSAADVRTERAVAHIHPNRRLKLE